MERQRVDDMEPRRTEDSGLVGALEHDDGGELELLDSLERRLDRVTGKPRLAVAPGILAVIDDNSGSRPPHRSQRGVEVGPA